MENNCFKRSFPCSSTKCISFTYVCDGVQDCWNGQDELNCQFPQSCSAWWNAGYQNNDVYDIGETGQCVQYNGLCDLLYAFVKLILFKLILVSMTKCKNEIMYGQC